MRLEKCWFCSSTVYPGHGIQFVRNDAKLGNKLNEMDKACSNPVPLIYSSSLGSARARSSSWAQIFRFCRSKCHKNFKMKRNPRKVKWTKAYRRLHGKDLTQDATFEFERKRNRPERYNRNVVEQTLKAMKKIDEVRVAREAKFWESRRKGKKVKEMKEAVREFDQNISLVQAPESLLKESASAEKIKVRVQKPKNVEHNPMESD